MESVIIFAMGDLGSCFWLGIYVSIDLQHCTFFDFTNSFCMSYKNGVEEYNNAFYSVVTIPQLSDSFIAGITGDDCCFSISSIFWICG